MMRTPAFWSRPEPTLFARLLSPVGTLYGAATARGMGVRGLRLDVPVVTIGNFVAGGAGKTPTAIAVAKLLAGLGERPAFLSRGYGAAARPEPREVNGQDAGVVGDEPLLLARVAPTFVSPLRTHAAFLALKVASPTVLVCDDGLQSRALEPTLALAVVDARTGVGNGLCVPAGPLRAPLADQIAHVDATILVGSGEAGEAVAALAEAAGKPCFYADVEPAADAQSLAGARVVAFAGIGAPEKFFATVRDLGARVVGTRSFADHHRYRPREIAQLQALARKRGAVLATTEKDAVRLPPGTAEPQPRTVGIDLVFRDEGSVRSLLRAALARTRRG